ncbi:MAG: hypothetical protein H6737_26745 [Alphaproteobacteria bacterium]|nr:hypothetical protein [Alphaproteobacteria bacterium]
MTSLALLFLVLTPAFAQGQPVYVPTPERVAVQSTERWELLAQAGRYDELAALSRDVVLTRRLSELKSAQFMQQRLHAQYQPRHPRRDAIDDRVRLLEGAVAEAALDLIAREQARQAQMAANVTPTQAPVGMAPWPAQSGVSQGEPSGAGAGAGAGAF